jgi:hypothetical protein
MDWPGLGYRDKWRALENVVKNFRIVLRLVSWLVMFES